MSEPQVVERLGPPLWIHFDEDGRVAEVYSKLYKDWSLENDESAFPE